MAFRARSSPACISPTHPSPPPSMRPCRRRRSPRRRPASAATRCGTATTTWRPFGYEEQEFFVSGTAARRGRHAGAVHDPHHRHPAVRPGPLQRHRAPRLGQRHRPVRERGRHDARPRDAHARGLRLRARERAGGRAVLHVPLLTPKIWDPVRYAAIDHPGDDWSVRHVHPGRPGVSRPTVAAASTRWARLGVGAWSTCSPPGSRSRPTALRTTSNEWLPTHPDAVGVIDGVLVHGNVAGRQGVRGRIAGPVAHLLSDFEAVDDGVDPAHARPELPAVGGRRRRPRRPLHRVPVRCSATGPASLAGAPQDLARPQYEAIIDAAGNYGEVRSHRCSAVCTAAGATMPMHYAASTAIHQLDAWVATGAAPPQRARGSQFAGGALAKDEHGNTLGGIRLPPIDVPVAPLRVDDLPARRHHGAVHRPAAPGAVRHPRRVLRADGGAHRRGRRRRVAAARGRRRPHAARLRRRATAGLRDKPPARPMSRPCLRRRCRRGRKRRPRARRRRRFPRPAARSQSPLQSPSWR